MLPNIKSMQYCLPKSLDNIPSNWYDLTVAIGITYPATKTYEEIEMATQAQVAQAWQDGIPCAASNMHTDGLTVWSYGWHKIGWTSGKNGEKIVILCSYSKTTRGKHVSALLAVCDGLDTDEHTNKAGHKLADENGILKIKAKCGIGN